MNNELDPRVADGYISHVPYRGAVSWRIYIVLNFSYQTNATDTIYTIADPPPIPPSLIVGRSKCDAEASVTRSIILFYFLLLCLHNTSLQPHIPISYRLQTINLTGFLVIELDDMHEESESDSLAKSS